MWQGVGDKKEEVKHLVFPFYALSTTVCHAFTFFLK